MLHLKVIVNQRGKDNFPPLFIDWMKNKQKTLPRKNTEKHGNKNKQKNNHGMKNKQKTLPRKDTEKHGKDRSRDTEKKHIIQGRK